MPALDPGRHRTRTCHFWAHAMDDRLWSGPSPPVVAYVFADRRGTEEIARQLKGFPAFCRSMVMPPTKRSRDDQTPEGGLCHQAEIRGISAEQRLAVRRPRERTADGGAQGATD